jgi:hypothetical protein
MFAPILIASILAVATHADPQRSTETAACKSAQLSAWFERQRSLTDGDTNPFVQAKAPVECQSLPK